MPNVIEMECYFKSAEMAKLCKAGKDIVIRFKASYSPDSNPTFEISADSLSEGGTSGKAIQSTALASAGKSTQGCPKPCS